MVFRKPYAFLIKNFRLMHIILTICCVYLLLKTSSILSFLNDYMASSDLVIGQNIVGTLYSPMMFIIPVLILVFLGVLLTVMIVKEKPKTYYVVNIIVYLATLILFIYGRGILANMEKEIVQPRTIKSLYDLYMYSLIFQIVAIITSSIRGIGFDIKKFDFGKDLQDLDVSSEDNEEFEISINFDANDTKRKLKKRVRHAKYVYLEHKLIINTIAVILLIVSGVWIYKNTNISIKKYNQNNNFTMNNFTINVVDSYLVNTDYKGNKLDNNLLVLKVKLIGNNKYNKKLVTGAFELISDNNSYHHNTRYVKELQDLGRVYTDQDITNEVYYLLVFDVGKDKLKNVKLKVSNLLSNDYVYVKIKYKNLTEEKEEQLYNVGDEVNITDSIINDIKFKINDYDIQDKFILNYTFCTRNDDCVPSIEYLRPDYYNTNHDLVLLKLKVNYETENEKLKDMFNFISLYGELEYKINGKVKTQNISKEVESIRVNLYDTYYIEVLDEVKDADEIYLVFNIRNNHYRYKIK